MSRVVWGVPVTVTASLKVTLTVMASPVAYVLSVPGFDVIATVETEGVVAWACTTDTRPRNRAMIANRAAA